MDPQLQAHLYLALSSSDIYLLVGGGGLPNLQQPLYCLGCWYPTTSYSELSSLTELY